jgi:hypothetical protein
MLKVAFQNIFYLEIYQYFLRSFRADFLKKIILILVHQKNLKIQKLKINLKEKKLKFHEMTLPDTHLIV